MHIIKMYS